MEYKNLCPRCGKERIVVKVWKSREGGSLIENTQTACPDKVCQDATNKEMRKQHERRLETEARKRARYSK
jgi:hypothetical protein